jgi:hypothetical protein
MMGLSLMNTLGLTSSVYFEHIACYWEVFLLHYTQVLCQYRLYRADHAYLTCRMLQRQLSHLNGRKLDQRHQDWLQTAPRYIASARTAHKIQLPRVLPFLHDATIGADRIENRFQQLLHCCVSQIRYLAMAVSLAPQFLRWVNMPQYVTSIKTELHLSEDAILYAPSRAAF